MIYNTSPHMALLRQQKLSTPAQSRLIMQQLALLQTSNDIFKKQKPTYVQPSLKIRSQAPVPEQRPQILYSGLTRPVTQFSKLVIKPQIPANPKLQPFHQATSPFHANFARPVLKPSQFSITPPAPQSPLKFNPKFRFVPSAPVNPAKPQPASSTFRFVASPPLNPGKPQPFNPKFRFVASTPLNRTKPKFKFNPPMSVTPKVQPAPTIPVHPPKPQPAKPKFQSVPATPVNPPKPQPTKPQFQSVPSTPVNPPKPQPAKPKSVPATPVNPPKPKPVRPQRQHTPPKPQPKPAVPPVQQPVPTVVPNSGPAPFRAPNSNYAPHIVTNGVLTDLNAVVDGVRLSGPRNLQNGNIVQLTHNNTAFYFNNGQLHSLPHEKASLLMRLFPRGLPAAEFHQWRIGDCTLLSPAKAVLVHNPVKLFDIIEPGSSPGKVQFHFKNANGARSVQEVAFHELMHQGVQGPLGIQLLETAFGRYLAQGKSTSALNVLNVGGYGIEALTAFGGRQIRMIYNQGHPLGKHAKTKAETLAMLKQIEKDPTHVIAIVATTAKHKEHKAIKDPKKFFPTHAYSVIKVNSAQRMLTLANPHNTAKPIQVSYDTLLKGFRRLILARV